MSKKTNKNKKNTNKKSDNKLFKGGSGEIHNYALNTLQHDPNYMQIAARNVHQTGGKSTTRTRTQKQKKTKKQQKGGYWLLNNFGAIDGQRSANIVMGNDTISTVSQGSPYIQPVGKS
jgi:hypothetical protein